MDSHPQPSEKAFTLLHLVLDSGERLPTLVEATTWFPVRVATRWALRYRRYRVQSSTLANNLRILGKVYTWAWLVGGFDLDDFLTSGQVLTVRQIESLASYLRTGALSQTSTSSGMVLLSPLSEKSSSIGASWFDHHLSIAEDFFTWALTTTNCGGTSAFSTLQQVAATRTHFQLVFASLRIGARPSDRIEPLADAELIAIRQVIEPKQDKSGKWMFPQGGFSPLTQLRNWLMFEIALSLGLRRGELLKLRLDCLPRGTEKGIRVPRLPDDPYDSRKKEPAVKTAERVIPASQELLRSLRSYLTLPPPMGRVRGSSPYLFVTRNGQPLSLDTADDIITKIGEAAGVPLSWHRLRHTWAEQTAEQFFDLPNGSDMLMYLGGWTHPESPKRYIQRVIEKHAIVTYQRLQQQN